MQNIELLIFYVLINSETDQSFLNSKNSIQNSRIYI